MLLSKFNGWRPYRLWKDYAAWLMFCAVLLGLTNTSASLDKIKGYGLHLPDVALTFGFLIFWGCLEAAAAAALLTLAQSLLEKVTGKPLDLLFRGLVIAVFALSWLLLPLTILRVV
jgi:hypothetical protein